MGAKRGIDDIYPHVALTLMINDDLEQVTCSEEKTVKFLFLSRSRPKLLQRIFRYRRVILGCGELAWLLVKLKRQLYEPPRETLVQKAMRSIIVLAVVLLLRY